MQSEKNMIDWWGSDRLTKRVLGTGQVKKRGILGTGQARKKGGLMHGSGIKKGVFTAAHICIIM